jgi:hypothetical protein
MSRIARHPNYVAGLLRFLEPELPPPLPSPAPPRRGRPKVLDTIRHKGQFLKAIAEISSDNPTLSTNSEIARALHRRDEYADVGPRQLRRNVAEALGWVVGAVAGKEPSARVMNRELRQKVLEILRYQLMTKSR